MAVHEFPLPDLGEGLTEGEILKWLVSEGDVITQNQPVVEVETAKAAVEIPAKWPGTVVRIFHPEGATVQVGAPLISIDTNTSTDTNTGTDRDPAGDSADGAAGEGSNGGGRTAVLVGYGPRTTTATRRPRKAAQPAGGRPLAKPPVRKLARDLGVDLHGLAGSGPAGSITREDVQAAVSAPPPSVPSPTAIPSPSPIPSPTAVPGSPREQRIPVRGVRKLAAENVSASAFTAPHVTEFLTVDMTRGIRALDRLRALPQWQEVRVSPLLLVAKAVLLAIRRHPMVNSTWDGAAGEIVVKEFVNLGIAAATERGLVVPNLKDADRMSLPELAEAMTELVRTAKAGRTAPADMSGGTFTITNIGVFGVDAGTPILPPGEAAILAFGAVRKAPWVHKGKVRPRQVTTLGLSFDHRIVDGELGSRFLADVGGFLTDPETALLAWG